MIRTLFVVLLLFFASAYADPLTLKTNLQYAQAGDYLVTTRNKNYTVLFVREKTPNSLVLDEITIGEKLFPSNIATWRDWLKEGAPGNTSWVRYRIDTTTGSLSDYQSVGHDKMLNIDSEDNLFTNLISLNFYPVPPNERRKTGSITSSSLWQPRMVVDGVILPNTPFICWKAVWPNDGSELSGKVVHIYLPEENKTYPSYFPYWLQITGLTTKAVVRIVDSGRNLQL